MKKAGAILGILVFTFSLLFCGMTRAEAAKIVIRANVSSNPKATPDLPLIHWYQTFKEELEKRAPDDVEVSLYWNSQLARTYADGINGIQNNIIQMANIPSATLSEYSKAMIPLNALFLVPYPHNEIPRKVFAGPLGERIRDKVIKDTGLRVISFWDFGFRHVLSKDKPILSVQDFKGLKLRCQPNPVQLEAFKALGANSTPITWAELFTSLQQGVVSATENPLVNIYQARLYEVTKYLSLTGHLITYNVVYVNNEWYKALPDNIKVAFEESVKVADQAYIKQFDALEAKFMGVVKGKMDVEAVSPEAMAEMRKITEPVSKREIVKLVGEEYYDYFIGEFRKAEESLNISK